MTRRMAWTILLAGCALLAACDKNTPLMEKVIADDPAAVEDAFRYDEDVLVERFVKGRELTVGILSPGNQHSEEGSQ